MNGGRVHIRLPFLDNNIFQGVIFPQTAKLTPSFIQIHSEEYYFPVDTRHKLNVLCTFNLRLVSTGLNIFAQGNITEKLLSQIV